MASNQLSPSQIAGYAQGAGLRGNAIVIAIAIALAESSGVYNVTHLNTDGSTDYGLWQINSVHKQFNTSQLLTPAYNAMAMAQISGNGSNWGPWTTYTTGAYRSHLSVAQQGYATLVGATTKQPTINTPSVDQVFNAKGLWKWYASPATQGFNGGAEKGEDFASAWGTPVGIVMGGTVVRAIHNNNSIGDVVEIQAGDGSVWLYQHIRRKVAPGQKVSTGDIVGTEDGLPVDQYSTGPHIEVRYCPPGRWSASTISWLEPWVNPAGVFSRAGTLPATGPNVSLAGVFDPNSLNFGAPTFGPPKVYTPLTSQVHETLINTPGFYGIALALDEAEQFPGWIDLTQPEQVDIPLDVLGVQVSDVKFPIPDVTGGVRSIGATISDNFTPFAIRSGLVLLGAILLLMLLAKAVAGPVESALPYILEAA